MTNQLGTIKYHGFDDEGYERYERLDAIAECPICGEDVECWADTDSWTMIKGQWRHSEYGGAHGGCCGLAFCSMPDGEFVTLDLRKQEAS